MIILEVVFWSCLAFFLYTYVGYPGLLALCAWLWPRKVMLGPVEGLHKISFVIAARNEEAAIDRRLSELMDLLARSGLEGEIILVSDSSTDGTAAVARSHGQGPVRVLELDQRRGKAVALSEGCKMAQGEILVFADVRQRWAPDALERLLENFADPEVGAVTGNLVLEKACGMLAGVGLYWRFEKWLRGRESQFASMVGVTGAISAVRRELFRPVPEGTLLDDVYWPLQVVLQHRRVVLDSRAVAYDRLPEHTRDEFRRKVRTLSGNLQLLTVLPRAWVPGLNPVWFQLVSHKLFRLLVPWSLLLMLGVTIALPGPVYRVALGVQLAGYLIGILGLVLPVSRTPRLLASASSFLVLNAAAWLAFWVWSTGRCRTAWTRAHYVALPEMIQSSPECGKGVRYLFPGGGVWARGQKKVPDPFLSEKDT